MMTTRELKKLFPAPNGKKALNRAIRQLHPRGAMALDAEHSARMAFDHRQNDAAYTALQIAEATRLTVENEVRAQLGLPTAARLGCPPVHLI